MSKNLLYAIILLLILITVSFKITYGFTPDKFIDESINQSEIKYYDYDPLSYTYSVCFIAGVHGNEPAGTEALKDLIKSNYFDQLSKLNNIKIRVIPAVNKWGLLYNNRYQPNIAYPDINRNFMGDGLEPSSNQIINMVKNFDVVVDFHEGWGYHLINHESVGSSISPGNTNVSIDIANKAIDEINKSIQNPLKKFVVLINHSCEIPKTLSCFRENQRKHYLLVETSGQNNIQSINTRKNQVYAVVNETLKYLKT